MLPPLHHATPPSITSIHQHIPAFPSVTGGLHPITVRSIGSYFHALAWAFLLLVSFTGWGRLLAKLARLQWIPVSVACSLGIATMISLGGFLNLIHAIYPATLLTLGGVGAFAYALLLKETPEDYCWGKLWQCSSPVSRILILLGLVILVARVAGTVQLASFNITDDSSAYLVFPGKMLALHQFAFDPFSDRRLLSSLGGAYFLQSFVISGTSLAHIEMADRTLGLLLLIPSLLDLGVAFGLLPYQVAVMEVLVSLVPQETFNLTFIVLPIALLLSMVWILLEIEAVNTSSTWNFALLLGALGGATVSVKSTYLPVACAIAIIPCILSAFVREWKRALTRAASVTGGALAVLLSWMIAMKLYSGTYLFPVLGHGLDYSSYIHVQTLHHFTGTRQLIKLFSQGFALAVMAGLMLLAGHGSKRSRLASCILIACALAITAFNYESGGDYIWRYNFPQFLCSVVTFYAAAAATLNLFPHSAISRIIYFTGLVALVSMVFYYDVSGTNPHPFRQFSLERQEYAHALRAGLADQPLESASILDEYRRVQRSLPNNGLLLENVAYPFLFNYKAHSIFVMDWPGAASPSPGWPYTGSTEELASYLKKSSVQYVIYDNAFTAWNDAKSCQSLETPDRFSNELDELMQLSVLADSQLHALRTDYKSVYDDGRISVVTLNVPRQNMGVSAEVAPSKDRIRIACETAFARYF
ncbi:MAG TPA: hypothetical protein VFN53_02870 [Acidobacteriaceae bacterium]|nr:hypothetical protein [Acidobacteriaceae bacterium]